jgi:hypothetical protein
VTIDGRPTATPGTVRQYVVNYPASHTLQIEMTGTVDRLQKSVVRTVTLNEKNLNYVVRFHPIPAENKEEENDKKPAEKNLKDQLYDLKKQLDELKNRRSKTPNRTTSAPEPPEFVAARENLRVQETKIAGFKAQLNAWQGKETVAESRLNSHNNLTPPTRLSEDNAKSALNDTEKALDARTLELTAVNTSIEQHEDFERSLQTKIRLLPRDTIASRTAKTDLIGWQAALSRLRLQASRLAAKIAAQRNVVVTAKAAHRAILDHNKAVDDKVFEHRKDELDSQLKSIQKSIKNVEQQIVSEELVRLKLVDKLFQLQGDRPWVPPANSRKNQGK